MTREEARASIKKHLDLMYPYNTPKDVLKVAYEALGQQQIIRCKDCKHRLECDYWIENGDDWFCADGEPKDGDGK